MWWLRPAAAGLAGPCLLLLFKSVLPLIVLVQPLALLRLLLLVSFRPASQMVENVEE
jgi:hypothetical protein